MVVIGSSYSSTCRTFFSLFWLLDYVVASVLISLLWLLFVGFFLSASVFITPPTCSWERTELHPPLFWNELNFIHYS